MSYANRYTDNVFLMPTEVVKHLDAKKSELAVILYIFSHGGNIKVSEAAEYLSLPEEEIISAIAFWRGAGVIDSEGEKKVLEVTSPKVKYLTTVSYTSEEISAAMDDEGFKNLCCCAEKKLGKVLNSNEKSALWGLIDSVGLPYDMLIGIIEYCASIKKPSIKYVERTAIGIYEDGIRSFEELLSYFRRKENERSAEAEVKRILGAENRAFTRTEKANVQKWVSEWGISIELISLAYEKTINAIAKPSVSYMSKILENWYAFGVKTPEEAENLYKNSKKSDEAVDKSLSLYDYIETPE